MCEWDSDWCLRSAHCTAFLWSGKHKRTAEVSTKQSWGKERESIIRIVTVKASACDSSIWIFLSFSSSKAEKKSMQFYSSSFSDLSFNYCCLTCLPSSSFMILSRSSFFSSSSVNSVNSTSFPTLSFEKVIQIVNPISERCSAFFVEKYCCFFLLFLPFYLVWLMRSCNSSILFLRLAMIFPWFALFEDISSTDTSNIIA